MSNNATAMLSVVDPPVDEITARTRLVIRQRVQESIDLKHDLLDDGLVDTLARLADQVVACVRAGGKLIFFGNGGSAADATHLAAEFVGRFAFDRGPMPALSLSDNASSLTAIGNDYSYDLTFSRQVQALGAPGDVAIAISTSGCSANVLAAMRAANERQMYTAAFTGVKGVELAAAAQHPVIVPSMSTARIQEGYMLYGHIMCELVEQEIFGRPTAVVLR